MNQAVQTLEGWYCLQDFRKIDWKGWKLLTSDERQAAINEFIYLIDKLNIFKQKDYGKYLFYIIKKTYIYIFF